METGIVLLNFGEPATPDPDAVEEYLTRIFFANASLEGDTTEEAVRKRSRELAKRRAPDLIEEYEAIGGSPLNEQSRKQAEQLEQELASRGFSIETYVAMQFTEPYIEDTARSIRDNDIDRVIGLPIYPLCGPSTTVAALEELATALDDQGFDGEYHEISGWHRHPLYNRIRAENISSYVEKENIDLRADETTLVFSAHGTPQHYLEEGSRYDIYVDEYCETMSSLLQLSDYALGFQNHENRDIPWTEPEIETVIENLDCTEVVVEPISFMHEQSETLSELDIELQEKAKSNELEFNRVPIPHDDPRFSILLADLVEPFITEIDPSYYQYRQCVCRNSAQTFCLNAPRES